MIIKYNKLEGISILICLKTLSMGDIIMNEVIDFLTENPQLYLATLGLDGNAKVRPILYYFEENEKPYSFRS